jgi:ADP-ribosylglycohydrolase
MRSATREGIERALGMLATASVRQAAETLGTGYHVSSSDTVPFCLFCAACFASSYEEAFWATVSGRGDRDTTCAIVGSIVTLHAGPAPAAWLASREPLA